MRRSLFVVVVVSALVLVLGAFNMSFSLLLTDRTGIGPIKVEGISSRLTLDQFKHILIADGDIGPDLGEGKAADVCFTMFGFKLLGTARLIDHIPCGAMLQLCLKTADDFARPGLESKAAAAVGLSVVRVPVGVTFAEKDGKTGAGLADEAMRALLQRLEVGVGDIDWYSRDGAAAASRQHLARAADNAHALLVRAAEESDNVEVPPAKRTMTIKDCDCLAHNMSDGVKHAIKANSPEDSDRNRNSNNSLPMRMLECTVEYFHANWKTLGVDGITLDIQCTDTRFESYFVSAAWIMTYRSLLLPRLFRQLGVQDDTSNLKDVIDAQWNQNAGRTLIALTQVEFLTYFAVYASLNHAIVKPFLQWSHSLRSHRFDELGQTVMGLMDAFVAISHSPEASGYFRNTFALTDAMDVERKTVELIIVSHLDSLLVEYVFNRADYLTALPHSHTFLMVEGRARTYATYLARVLWGDLQNPEDDALLALVEPLELRTRPGLREDLEKVANGVFPLPERLLRRFYEVFAAVLVAQSGSEANVKVAKWVLRDDYKRPENVTARYRMFSNEHDWLTRCQRNYPDDSSVLRELRTLIREAPTLERQARSLEQHVAPEFYEAIGAHDHDDIARRSAKAMQNAKAGSRGNTKSRAKGLLSEEQTDIASRAFGTDETCKPIIRPDSEECPCCERFAVRCWPAFSSSSVNTPPTCCNCELPVCYYCLRVLSMAQQIAASQLTCPNCNFARTGALIERNGTKCYEATPSLPSANSEADATTATAEEEEEENVDPNTTAVAPQEKPSKKKRKKSKKPPECSVCRLAGLTTPTTTKIGGRPHNKPCPLFQPPKSTSAPKDATTDNPLPNHFVNAGACTSASNTEDYRGPRITTSC